MLYGPSVSKNQIVCRRIQLDRMHCTVIMMLLTTTDVIMRLVATPIPGVYEIVGLLNVAVSFPAYTSVEKGHRRAEFLVSKLSRQTQAKSLPRQTIFFTGSVFLHLPAMRRVCRRPETGARGRGLLTIQMPIYPFVAGNRDRMRGALHCAAAGVDSINQKDRSMSPTIVGLTAFRAADPDILQDAGGFLTALIGFVGFGFLVSLKPRRT